MSTISRRFLLKTGGVASMLALAPSLRAEATGVKDSQWVRLALETLHPGLYRFQTPDQFTARHAVFAKAFEGGDFDQKIGALQELLGAVRCGHTYINPANQSEAVQQQLYGARRVLPWHFRWIDDAIVVTGDPYAGALAAGTVVHGINGLAAADILAALLPFARADGSNDAKRRALMSVGGGYRWEMFDLYFDLIFKPERWITIDATKPDGQRIKMRMETLDHSSRGLLSGEAGADAAAPVWFADTANGGSTRIITMPTWAVYKTKWDWEGWLRGQLAEIMTDGTTGLVMDLRGNEGGLTIGEGLIPFFLSEPLTVTRAAQRVRFKAVPDNLKPLLDTWDPRFFEIGKDGMMLADGLIEVAPPREAVIEPEAKTFGGKVAVLINADNSSATFLFAEQLRAAGVATLIGETTGGNQRGINGDAYFFVRLPESGIEFDVPLIGYFPGGKPPDAGLEPDESVTQTAADIAVGRDRAMERAIEALA